jgi:hypothetical protein
MQVETTGVVYGPDESGVRVALNTGDEWSATQTRGSILLPDSRLGGQILHGGWCESYRIPKQEVQPQGDACQELAPMRRHPSEASRKHGRTWWIQGKADYSIPESSLAALEMVEGAYVSKPPRCKVDSASRQIQDSACPRLGPWRPYSGKGRRSATDGSYSLETEIGGHP